MHMIVISRVNLVLISRGNRTVAETGELESYHIERQYFWLQTQETKILCRFYGLETI
jgi:hypothetical protein